MPLWLPLCLMILAILVTVASGIWLMLNANAVARLFRRSDFIEPGPGPRLASRNSVIAALIAFNLGWIAAVGLWSWSTTDAAQEAVQADSFQ